MHLHSGSLLWVEVRRGTNPVPQEAPGEQRVEQRQLDHEGDDIDGEPIGAILAHPVWSKGAKPGEAVSRHLPVYPYKKFEAVGLGG